jgi:integrase/recombinase XerD
MNSSSLARISSDQKLIEMWLHGRPSSTQTEYGRDVHYFLEFVDKPLPQMSLEDLQNYATHLQSQGYKERTIRRKLNSIKSLFTFATKLNYTRFNVAAALRLPKGNQALAGRILKQVDVLRLINAAPPGRDRALLKLIYATGMRASEAVKLRWSDFYERDSGEVQVTVLGKGEKLRTVLVPPSTWVEVEALRGVASGDDPVFQSVRGKTLDRTMAHKIIKEAAIASGINPKTSLHWLRHSHATHALAKGAPIGLVRDSLGHSSIQTTNFYIHSNPEDSSGNYLGL